MKVSFYTGTMGTLSNQANMNVIANNLANVNTAGYKAQRGCFTDLIYTKMLKPEKTTEENLMVGHGSKLEATANVFSQGGILETGDLRQITIDGDGFFAVRSRENEDDIYYTKCGDFTQSLHEDGKVYLTTVSGELVLDEEYNPIDVSEYSVNTHMELNSETAKNPFGVGIFGFENEYALKRVGSTMFSANDLSGEAQVMDNYNLISGYVETSNVDTATEFANLITTQRAFQMNVKVVQNATEMEEIINRLW